MLFPKYFGKLSDIHQLNIIRLHLWKIWVCSSWGELRSHYPIFLGVWLPFLLRNIGKFRNFLISFVFGIMSWKCETCSWWVKIYPEMGPICLVPGIMSPNLGELTEWISFLLQILTCLEGQTFWGKWSEITRQELSVYNLQKSGASRVFTKFP